MWFGCAVLSIVPLLEVAIPPLTDMPNHIVRYYIFLYISSSPFLSQHYAVHWSLIGNL